MSITNSDSGRPEHDGTAPAGALTTVFAPPASCTEDIDIYYATRSCMPQPERWNLYWSAASYYSPAICPSGMESVAPVPAYFGPPIERDETALVCCPSGFTLSTAETEHYCEGSVEFKTYDVTLTPYTIKTSGDIRKGFQTSYFTSTSLATKLPIQIRWRESDLSKLETHPLSPGVTVTGAEKPSNSSDTERKGGTGRTGLDTGAIVGIVVGVAVGLAILAIGIFLLVKKAKRNRRNPSMKISPSNGIAPVVPGLSDDAARSNSTASPMTEGMATSESQHYISRRAQLQMELVRLDEEEARKKREGGYELACKSPSEADGVLRAELPSSGGEIAR